MEVTPPQIVCTCKKHGDLTLDKTYPTFSTKKGKKYCGYRCKICVIGNVAKYFKTPKGRTTNKRMVSKEIKELRNGYIKGQLMLHFGVNYRDIKQKETDLMREKVTLKRIISRQRKMFALWYRSQVKVYRKLERRIEKIFIKRGLKE